MPIHDPQLPPDRRPAARVHRGLLHRPVAPQAHRHVVAGTDEHVAGVRAPRQLPYGVVVARHHRQGSPRGVADVEGAYDPVYAAGGYHGVAVLVPVLGEDLGGGGGLDWGAGERRLRRRVDGNGGHEVVFRRGGRAEVVDAQVGVG